eukprot:7766397-Ditylum_brightwellii.AAC.2
MTYQEHKKENGAVDVALAALFMVNGDLLGGVKKKNGAVDDDGAVDALFAEDAVNEVGAFVDSVFAFVVEDVVNEVKAFVDSGG